MEHARMMMGPPESSVSIALAVSVTPPTTTTPPPPVSVAVAPPPPATMALAVVPPPPAPAAAAPPQALMVVSPPPPAAAAVPVAVTPATPVGVAIGGAGPSGVSVAQPSRGAPPPTSLAPGFRFHPTDEELVRYYLRRKACGMPFRFHAVSEIDVYKSEPWELADYSSLKTRDLEWYFFSPVDRKYGNGSRLNRATGKGYWKATGKDRCVRHKSKTIGMKKTLVFHGGRAPDGKRTNWVMHEYRLVDEELGKAGVVQDSFVLCRIFQKSGLGPPNGDRYAPFLDEEWEDDTTHFIPGVVDVEDDMGNGDEARISHNDFEQDMNKAPAVSDYPAEPQAIPFLCKRERAEEVMLSLGQKRPRQDDPSSSNANGSNGGSEDSTTTSQDPASKMMTTTNFSSSLLEFPLHEKNTGPKESQPVSFDSSNLEKSVPPGFLKFISNLENEILNVSMDRETLKIEVMRAQAMINILQSRIDLLNKENEDLRRMVRGG